MRNKQIKIKISIISLAAALSMGGAWDIDNQTYSGGTLPEICVSDIDPNNFRTSLGMFPKQDFAGNIRVDSVSQWNDTILLACLIATESMTATLFEKKLIAQTVVDRAKVDYNKLGQTITQQIFAPAQFSGVVKRSNNSRWCYYFHGKIWNNPIVKERFRYEPSNNKRVIIKRNGEKVVTTYRQLYFENYQAAREVLQGKRPIEQRVLYFLNPTISTDSAQVKKVMRRRYFLPQKTKHIFAG